MAKLIDRSDEELVRLLELVGGADLSGEQQTKTKTALEFFSNERVHRSTMEVASNE